MIFVVDDSPSDLTLMQTALKKAGFAVTAFDSGWKFMQAIKSEQPLCVVSDVVMDEVEGVELVKHLTEHYPGLPVVVVSGFAEYLEFITDLGASATVHKSVGFESGVVDAVSNLLACA